jgi:hypothetical protein
MQQANFAYLLLYFLDIRETVLSRTSVLNLICQLLILQVELA